MYAKQDISNKIITFGMSLGLSLLAVPVLAADFSATNIETMALQGNAQAQYNLAVMYARGQGVLQDDTKAVQWYEKSAHQGVDSAQNMLCLIYYNGKGVP